MNDLRPHRVFLSNAFEPSEDEIDDFAAEERARKSQARSRGRAVPPPVKPVLVKKEQKKVTLETLEISDLSESDDDMPDISSIVKGSAKNEKPTPTKKEKVKDEFGFDDMEGSDEDELDDDEECVLGVVLWMLESILTLSLACSPRASPRERRPPVDARATGTRKARAATCLIHGGVATTISSPVRRCLRL